MEQQRVAEVPVEIIHDMQPEFNEDFKIRLISAYGGAVLGSQLECTVTILQNDYPYGLIGQYLFDVIGKLFKFVIDQAGIKWLDIGQAKFWRLYAPRRSGSV